MDHSPSMKFVMMRARAELKAAHSDALGVEHIFLALLKLAELHAGDFISAPENVLAVIDQDIRDVHDTVLNVYQHGDTRLFLP